ncbi:MAG: fasciclin domain-containing protein [Sphingobacteriales bacterium]|jgi:uncharacterized surface protein with fasciclin (FAS1) repeats|nr:fasciclin domain-containing protein [Sphingobacteriales bacterium]
MKKISMRIMMVMAIAVFSVTSCSSGASMLSSGSSLLSSMGANPSLSSMTSLLQTPGLGKIMGPALKGPFTMLAPSNSALSSLGPDAISSLTKPENINQLADVLKNHIVPGKLDANSLMKGGLKTAGGKDLNLAGVNMSDAISGKNFNVIPVDKILK